MGDLRDISGFISGGGAETGGGDGSQIGLRFVRRWLGGFLVLGAMERKY